MTEQNPLVTPEVAGAMQRLTLAREAFGPEITPEQLFGAIFGDPNQLVQDAAAAAPFLLAQSSPTEVIAGSIAPMGARIKLLSDLWTAEAITPDEFDGIAGVEHTVYGQSLDQLF